MPPFFINFKNAKKIWLFSYFFLRTCPQAHHLQSKKFNFFLNLCGKILFCRHYINTFLRKGKDPKTDPEPDRIRSSYKWMGIWIQEAQKHADPQHCF
jgi:hypothetical protein